MPERRIGPFETSALGFGCMNLSHAYGDPPDEATGLRLLNRALDLGFAMLDTAALYGGGSNERLISRVMHRRSEFVLASKCVLEQRDGRRVLDGSPKAITRTLDEALKRLRTDHIDLYYLHRLDRRVPIEDSVGALVRALEVGKIRAIGLSEMSAATLRRAHRVHAIAAMQSEYSPASRNPEIALLDTCRELDVGLVAFSPLSRGLLAGSVHDDRYPDMDIRRGFPRFIEPRLSANLAIVERYNAIARDVGLTPAQLSLGWVLAQGDTIIPIPGTRDLLHLEENAAAASLVLKPEILARIDAVMPPNALAGARYACAAQSQIDTELFEEEELDR